MINVHLDTERIAHHFAKAHTTYATSAIVQHGMCQTLMGMLLSACPDTAPNSVLEIGCGVGNLTDIYTKHWQLDKLYLNDLYDIDSHHQADVLIGDIEKMNLPSVDMVLSGSALQWIKDLPRLLSNIHHALPTGGVLAFSSFGKDNLHQIKTLTGVGLEYHSLAELIIMLQQAGFTVIESHQAMQTLYFDHPKQILHHIRQTGVAMGSMTWTKSSLVRFYHEYQDRFATFDGYPLDYDTLFIVAKKPIAQ